jgi:hypothetical protein
MMSKQKPGKSKQDYQTPKIFLDAVKARFGIKRFAWDLAATKDNAVNGVGGDKWIDGHYFGPDHPEPEFRDALACDWTKLRGELWLNPPYANIAPWAERCAASAKPGVSLHRRIFLLVPARGGLRLVCEVRRRQGVGATSRRANFI